MGTPCSRVMRVLLGSTEHSACTSRTHRAVWMSFLEGLTLIKELLCFADLRIRSPRMSTRRPHSGRRFGPGIYAGRAIIKACDYTIAKRHGSAGARSVGGVGGHFGAP